MYIIHLHFFSHQKRRHEESQVIKECHHSETQVNTKRASLLEAHCAEVYVLQVFQSSFPR